MHSIYNKDENEEKFLNFLEMKIKKQNNGRYEFDIYRKSSLRNIQINPQSCITSSTITSQKMT